MVVFLSFKGPVCKIFVAYIANQLNTPRLTLPYCDHQQNKHMKQQQQPQ